jgi:hypothetical protein
MGVLFYNPYLEFRDIDNDIILPRGHPLLQSTVEAMSLLKINL